MATQSTPPTSAAAGNGSAAHRFTPLYFRIQEGLREKIVSGELGPGDRLPSESELAKEFATTRSTVRHALSLLVFEGLIVRHIGRGSFVAAKPSVAAPIDTRECRSFESQVALTGKQVDHQLLSYKVAKASADLAKRLRISEGSEVFRLERLRLIENRPVCLEIRYILKELGEQLTGEMLASRSVYDSLSEILGEAVAGIVVSVVAEAADKKTAELLELTTGSPLLVRENSHHDSTGRPLLWGRSIFPGDIRLEYVLGQQPSPPPGD